MLRHSQHGVPCAAASTMCNLGAPLTVLLLGRNDRF
jgi:hypothetical protein